MWGGQKEPRWCSPGRSSLLCSWWQSRQLASAAACVRDPSQKVKEGSHHLSQEQPGASQAVQGGEGGGQ